MISRGIYPQFLSFREWYHGDTITLMAMTVRFTEEQDTQLTQLSEILGVSKQQALMTAVEEALQSRDHNAKFEAAKERALTRYADVIRRLGE